MLPSERLRRQAVQKSSRSGFIVLPDLDIATSAGVFGVHNEVYVLALFIDGSVHFSRSRIIIARYKLACFDVDSDYRAVAVYGTYIKHAAVTFAVARLKYRSLLGTRVKERADILGYVAEGLGYLTGDETISVFNGSSQIFSSSAATLNASS